MIFFLILSNLLTECYLHDKEIDNSDSVDSVFVLDNHIQNFLAERNQSMHHNIYHKLNLLNRDVNSLEHQKMYLTNNQKKRNYFKTLQISRILKMNANDSNQLERFIDDKKRSQIYQLSRFLKSPTYLLKKNP